jgi:hypothetical protein
MPVTDGKTILSAFGPGNKYDKVAGLKSRFVAAYPDNATNTAPA